MADLFDGVVLTLGLKIFICTKDEKDIYRDNNSQIRYCYCFFKWQRLSAVLFCDGGIYVISVISN